MFTYLSLSQIIRLNQRTIEAHGGNFVPPDNLLHEESLKYLIDAVEAEMFGQPLYPTVADKAALYLHSIVSNHVFQDGNKRTGLGAALAFCRLNGYRVVALEKQHSLLGDLDFPTANAQLLYNFTMQVASSEHDLDAVRGWFTRHLQQL